MFKIAVCDDEKNISGLIAHMLKKHLPESHIEKFSLGKSLLSADKHYDIVFLDICMEGMNGIETAKGLRLRDKDTIIIFITGIKEYVFDAFDVGAFHYLLKPVNEDKLKEVLLRAASEIKNKDRTHKKQLFIEKKGRNITLNMEDILFLEKENHRVIVHTKTEKFTFYGVMSELEEKVGNGFFRCHRGYLVNMSYITEYDNKNIYLAGGERVYLARDKYQDFVKRYMRFLRDGGTGNA